MKKIKYYILFLLPIIFLMGCTNDEVFSITAKITSITSTSDTISFFTTITVNESVEVKAILEEEEKLIYETSDIVLNQTKEYTFYELESDKTYSLSLKYSKNSSDFIILAKEQVKTKPSNKPAVEILCNDLEVIYDGSPKSLNATTNIEGLPLTYNYFSNGNEINLPVDAGEYEVKISFVGNDTYAPCSITKKIIIKKADVTITCEDLEVTYDGTPKGIQATTNVEDIALIYTYYQNGLLVEEPKDAGTYQVKIRTKENKNYNVSETDCTIVILPKPIDISYPDFTIKYGEIYKIELPIIQNYSIAYYQNEILLPSKPTLPGTYIASITITDKNFTGSKNVEFKIEKLYYTVPYQSGYILFGEVLNFDLEVFVQIQYYLGTEKVDGFSVPGEYTVYFSFQNHPIYYDLEHTIQIKVDNKKHVLLEEDEFFVECLEDYEILYHLNYDIKLDITYYKGEQRIEKPLIPGEYRIHFSLEETEEYAAFEKTCTFILYPSLNQIKTIEEGLFYTEGKIIAKDHLYSYMVDDGAVLCITDSNLTIGTSYEIIGNVQYYNEKYVMNPYKYKEVVGKEQRPESISLLEYKDKVEEYKNAYISLKGLVIEQDAKCYLVLEEGFQFLLTKKYSAYVENRTPLEIHILSFGESYILISDNKAQLNRKEELYAAAFFYAFSEQMKELPTSIEPLGIRLEYLETSHPEVIDIITCKVYPKLEDIEVTIKVKLILDDYILEKIYKVKIIKQEEKELNIYSIEMHQQYGDSILITYGDFEILIDAGDTKDGPYVNQFLKEHISQDNHLDMIIVSHCHSDHMGGLAYGANESSSKVKALDGIASIGTIIDYGHDRSTNALHRSWVEIRNRYIAGGTSYYPIYDAAKNLNGAKSHYEIDDKLSLDFLDTATYLEPATDMTSSATKFNIYSVASLLTYDNFKFFFAGDLEDVGERNLLNNLSNTPLKDITEENVVLYKAAHHGTDPGANNGGSQGGNQLPFLKALKPDYFFASAAMCDGGGGFIGGQPHPYPRCLANFYYFNDNVYFNGTNGTLEFITDGKTIKTIHGFGATTSYLVDGSSIDYASQMDLKLIDTLWYKKYRKDAVEQALASLS